MPSNIEIKAKVTDFFTFIDRAKEVSGQDGQIISQRDTFFNCTEGRLKLRCLKNDEAELIFYRRPDENGPKLSEYSVVQVQDPDNLRNALRMAYGIKGEVRKTRTLFLVGQTRIHADEVEKLGEFMELEVQMKDGQSIEDGEKIARDLMDKLGIMDKDLITGAYMDHILKNRHQNGNR